MRIKKIYIHHSCSNAKFSASPKERREYFCVIQLHAVIIFCWICYCLWLQACDTFCIYRSSGRAWCVRQSIYCSLSLPTMSVYNKWTSTYLQSPSHFNLPNIFVATNVPFLLTPLADTNWIYQSHINWRPPLVPNCYYPYIFASLSLSFLLFPLWSIGHPWNALFDSSFLILR
jgi:hypothetical protein